jgi:hypothetical protein
MLKRLIKGSGSSTNSACPVFSTATNCAFWIASDIFFCASSSGDSADAMTSGGGFFVSVPLLQFLSPSATAFEKRFESSKNQKPRQRITRA